MLILALILAQLLNDATLRFKGLFRTMIFLPCATSLVSYSMIFKSLFAPDGFVNMILTKMGIVRSRLVPECMGGQDCDHHCTGLEMDRI